MNKDFGSKAKRFPEYLDCVYDRLVANPGPGFYRNNAQEMGVGLGAGANQNRQPHHGNLIG